MNSCELMWINMLIHECVWIKMNRNVFIQWMCMHLWELQFIFFEFLSKFYFSLHVVWIYINLFGIFCEFTWVCLDLCEIFKKLQGLHESQQLYLNLYMSSCERIYLKLFGFIWIHTWIYVNYKYAFFIWIYMKLYECKEFARRCERCVRAVRAAVCGGAHGIVCAQWCAWQCAAALLVVYGSAHGSVRLSSGAAVCGSLTVSIFSNKF